MKKFFGYIVKGIGILIGLFILLSIIVRISGWKSSQRSNEYTDPIEQKARQELREEYKQRESQKDEYYKGVREAQERARIEEKKRELRVKPSVKINWLIYRTIKISKIKK
jgi:hypothetical protein